MALYQHGVIQDVCEALKEEGFLIEGYRNSVRIKHKFFDFAIFIHKGWLKFSDVFKMKARYDNVKRFITKLVKYIRQKFKLKIEKKLAKFEPKAKEFIERDDVVIEQRISNEREARRMKSHMELDAILEAKGIKKDREFLEYSSRMVATNVVICIEGLIHLTIRKNFLIIRRIESLSKKVADEFAEQFCEFMGLDYYSLRKDYMVRSNSYLLTRICQL